MENEKFKYIAALEVSNDEIHFGVSRISLVESSFIVVHKNRLFGSFIENDRLINKESVIDFLHNNIVEFESTFKSKITDINLIIPDDKSVVRKNYETLKFSVPKPISNRDINEFKKYVSNKLSGDYEMVIKTDCQRIFIDNKEVRGKNFNLIGKELSSNFTVTLVKKLFVSDCNDVIAYCEKKIKKISTYSMTIGNLICGNDNRVNAIVNWSNKKTVLTFYSSGIVWSVKEINLGLETIIDNAMNVMPGVKKATMKQYLFNMLEFENQKIVNDNVIFRKFTNGEKLEYTKSDFKHIVLKSINYIVSKIDETISMTLNYNNNINVYHLGKIAKFANSEKLISSVSAFGKQTSFPKYDSIGASENWALTISSSMAADAKKIYNKVQIEKMNKNKIKQNLNHQQTLNLAPMHGYHNRPQNNGLNSMQPNLNQNFGAKNNGNLNNNYNNYQTIPKNYIK